MLKYVQENNMIPLLELTVYMYTIKGPIYYVYLSPHVCFL